MPSFKKSLYSSQSKLDQWCFPYLYDNRISIFEASGGGGNDLVVPNLPALLVLTVSSNFFRNLSIFVSSLLTRYFDIPTYVMSSAYFGVIRKYFICFDWFDKKFCKVEHKQYCTETITLYNCCISFETLPDGFFYLHFNFRLIKWRVTYRFSYAMRHNGANRMTPSPTVICVIARISTKLIVSYNLF